MRDDDTAAFCVRYPSFSLAASARASEGSTTSAFACDVLALVCAFCGEIDVSPHVSVSFRDRWRSLFVRRPGRQGVRKTPQFPAILQMTPIDWSREARGGFASDVTIEARSVDEGGRAPHLPPRRASSLWQTPLLCVWYVRAGSRQTLRKIALWKRVDAPAYASERPGSFVFPRGFYWIGAVFIHRIVRVLRVCGDSVSPPLPLGNSFPRGSSRAPPSSPPLVVAAVAPITSPHVTLSRTDLGSFVDWKEPLPKEVRAVTCKS